MFDGFDLRGAFLGSSDFNGAHLFLANLQSTFLLLTNLNGADLTGANLQ